MRRHLLIAAGVALVVLGAGPPAWAIRANPTATRSATAGTVGVTALPQTPSECAEMTFAQVIVGTEGDDVLTGGNGSNLIFGLGGKDTIHGNNAGDCLVGGDGDDQLYGENAKDFLLGGPGEDLLIGGEGKDYLDGGADEDACEAASTGETVINCEELPD